ncbi:MAG: glucose-6-phosphate isomerase, partial [Burkholderiaceae bacterium]
MHYSSLETSATFEALQLHYEDAQHWELRQLFAEDPMRFSSLSMEAAGLFLDYSKNKINGKTLALLCTLARERGVEERRDAMFAGEKINRTEHRAVLHTALRAPRGNRLLLDGHDINQDIHA